MDERLSPEGTPPRTGLRTPLGDALEVVCERAGDALVLAGPDGLVRYASPAVERLFGWSPDDWVGSPPFRAAHRADRESVAAALAEISAGRPRPFELRLACADGSVRCVEVVPAPLEAGGAVFVVRDVHARRTRDEAVADRLRLLEEEREGSPDGYVVSTSEGRMFSCNRRVFEILGLDAEEAARVTALGSTAEAREAFIEAVARRCADPAGYVADVRRLLASGPPVAVDEIALRDGRVVERYSAVTRDTAGKPSGRFAVFRDITRRKHVESELMGRARQQAAVASLGELAMNSESLEPLLRAACGTVTDVLGADACALVERSEQGALSVAAACGLGHAVVGTALGSADGSHAGTCAASAGSSAERDAARRWPEDAFLRRHGIASVVVAALPGRDASAGALAAYARTPRTFAADELSFLESVASILAAAMARGRAEQELLARERQMRAVFHGALDAMMILDDDAVIRDANPAACALLGRSRASLVGRPLGALVRATRGARELVAGWRRLRHARHVSGETEFAVPGHGPRAVQYAAVADIVPGRHLAVARDVTEERALHARLALADRMVSVGTLAAGVAHELNNPLAFVNANLVFVAERLASVRAGGTPPEDLPDTLAQMDEAVRDARDGAERMRVIVRDLRTFSRADDDGSVAADVHAVLESCISMAWNEIRHRARLVRDLGPVARVTASEARLGQVFLNLLVNAAQAIPEGRAEDNEITVSTRSRAGGRIAVAIRDTGCGIAPEIRKQLFDPFFTTKPPGVGTGLGLSICHGIVSALGGEIEVESEVGHGSTFRVVLPAAVESSPDARAPAGAASGARPRRGRVLVVDDEPLVGAVLQRTLHADHDVTVVGSARAALDAFERGERFDVVLSDLLMPEMTGMELYRELARRDPDLARRVVFLTGGAFTPGARDFLEHEEVQCVEKPFELDAIRDVLSRKLAEVEPG